MTSLQESLNESLDTIKELADSWFESGRTNATAAADLLQESDVFVLQVWNSIMDSYGFEPPESDIATAAGAESEGPSADKAIAALDTAQLIVSYLTHWTSFQMLTDAL